MSELIIRKACESDLWDIEKIEQACFAVPWSYESLRHDILENKLSLYIVAQVDDAVCGYVGVWKIFEEGHITNVAVLPSMRRKHIASAMLSVLIDVTGEEGISSYTLEVRQGNEAAIRLYEGFGFVREGIRKGYYEDNGEDAIIMWKKVGAGGADNEGAGGEEAGGGEIR